MAIKVIKVTGYDVIWDATVVASDIDTLVTISGWNDVTRFWGYHEANTTTGIYSDTTEALTFDFTNLPADSTEVIGSIPTTYRDKNGKDRRWKPITITVNKYDIESQVDFEA